MQSPTININDNILIIPPSPPTPKPNADPNMENLSAEEKYKARNVFSKNNEMISSGRNTSSKPKIYGDFDLKIILIYAIIIPIKR